MDKNRKPLLAITMGDPGGIGPEICVKALDLEDIYAVCRPLVVGDAGIIRNAMEFCGLCHVLNAGPRTGSVPARNRGRIGSNKSAPLPAHA